MHERNKLNFWQHHALVILICIPFLAILRMIGQIAVDLTTPDLYLHSAIVVLVAYPQQTVAAYLSMRFLSPKIPLRFRAIIGCVLAGALIAFDVAGLGTLITHAKNPVTAGVLLIFGFAVTEALGIFSLLIAFLLLFAV